MARLMKVLALCFCVSITLYSEVSFAKGKGNEKAKVAQVKEKIEAVKKSVKEKIEEKRAPAKEKVKKVKKVIEKKAKKKEKSWPAHVCRV